MRAKWPGSPFARPGKRHTIKISQRAARTLAQVAFELDLSSRFVADALLEDVDRARAAAKKAKAAAKAKAAQEFLSSTGAGELDGGG